jgi:hypothetical protein
MIPRELQFYLDILQNNAEHIYIGYSSLYVMPELMRFTNIISLKCGYNFLKEIPYLPNTLQQLYCNNNNLIALPPLPSGLRVLECDKNKLSLLPPLPHGLHILTCDDNQLNYLPKLPLESLVYFSCIRNPFIEYLRNGRRMSLETINNVNEIIHRFRYLYYLLKCKWKFLEIFIKIKMKPENIAKLLENETLSLELDKLDTFDIL